jgi:ribosomal protein L40E
MQVCFTCGAPNPPDAPECEACGADLPAGQAPPPPPPPAEAPDPADSKCPFCNQQVEPDAKECPHCRLNLDAKDPLNQPAPRGHADNMTGRYEDFQKKVEGLRMGSVTPQAFIEWLTQIRGTLEGKRNLYIKTIQETGYYDMHREEVDIATVGILDFEDAVEDMWEFTLGKTDISGLDTALAKMWQANEKINEAMRMNRGFRAQLEDDWGYM